MEMYTRSCVNTNVIGNIYAIPKKIQAYCYHVFIDCYVIWTDNKTGVNYFSWKRFGN